MLDTQHLATHKQPSAPHAARSARHICAELSLLVEEFGSKVTVEGFDRLEVSNANVVVPYDRKQIEAVILKLIDLEQYGIADAIRSWKQESARSGTLRILCALPEVQQ